MPFWKLYYHIIWATKNRLPLILPEIEPQLYSVIVVKARKLDAIFYAIGGVENHVHLVVSIPPKIALTDFIGQIKGASSHFANQELKLMTPFAWQEEYGVLSFGNKQLETIIKYVNNQKQHHANATEINYLERFEA